jgi:uncharacterized protein (DUF1800 family)
MACDGRAPEGVAPLAGQVATPATYKAGSLTHYAASRFLDQASMGASPIEVAKLRTVGIDAWVSEQLSLPISQTVTPYERREYVLLDRAMSDAAAQFQGDAMQTLMVSAPDQLRVRVAWILSNYIVVSVRRVQPYGGTEFFNLLMRHAFDRYDELLRQVTIAPAMGFFLDNAQNNSGRLNENYARELLQLFSLGVMRLNQDGTVMRDSAGKLIQTYTQNDVVGAARALTGWQFAPLPEGTVSGSANWANYGAPMVPVEWGHDTGSKTVLGKTIPQGQTALDDLRSLVAIIMAHPNTAPFVSVRLIQGLTTSDPSPAYVARVAATFVRTSGHLGEVVKAILTDPEARAGDVPSRSAPGFGRIREPHLAHTVIWRGLGCRRPPPWGGNGTGLMNAYTQPPMGAPTVFGFTAPSHRAPGSNLQAPEQKLMSSDEMSRRLGLDWNIQRMQSLKDAGCDVDALQVAYEKGEDAMLDLLEARFMRGSMPQPVRQGIKSALKGQDWIKETASRHFGGMIALLSMAPGFGASK